MIDNITVLDFETSGLNPEKDQVIEMAAIRVRGGKVVGEFSTLVHFPGNLSQKITDITGIKQSDLAAAFEVETAFRIMNKFIENSILVAHNAAFDLAFLHFNLMKFAGRTFDNTFIDSCTIARERFTYPHKLDVMCERFGIKLEGAHRALNDVYGCWELLKAMHAESPVDEFLNKLGYVRKYGAPDWTPPHANVYPIDLRFEDAG